METSSAIECIHYSMMMMMMVLHLAHNVAHQASQDKSYLLPLIISGPRCEGSVLPQ